jgi:hypothetical protein
VIAGFLLKSVGCSFNDDRSVVDIVDDEGKDPPPAAEKETYVHDLATAPAFEAVGKRERKDV